MSIVDNFINRLLRDVADADIGDIKRYEISKDEFFNNVYSEFIRNFGEPEEVGGEGGGTTKRLTFYSKHFTKHLNSFVIDVIYTDTSDDVMVIVYVLPDVRIVKSQIIPTKFFENSLASYFEIVKVNNDQIAKIMERAKKLGYEVIEYDEKNDELDGGILIVNNSLLIISVALLCLYDSCVLEPPYNIEQLFYGIVDVRDYARCY